MIVYVYGKGTSHAVRGEVKGQLVGICTLLVTCVNSGHQYENFTH